MWREKVGDRHARDEDTGKRALFNRLKEADVAMTKEDRLKDELGITNEDALTGVYRAQRQFKDILSGKIDLLNQPEPDSEHALDSKNWELGGLAGVVANDDFEKLKEQNEKTKKSRLKMATTRGKTLKSLGIIGNANVRGNEEGDGASDADPYGDAQSEAGRSEVSASSRRS